jgi:hypothetical protein
VIIMRAGHSSTLIFIVDVCAIAIPKTIEQVLETLGYGRRSMRVVHFAQTPAEE